MFVLLKQSFPTDLAYFGRFVLINLAWQSNGRFSDTDIIQSLGQNGSVSDLAQSLDFDRDADFKTPIYNIWNFAKLSNEVKHFGNACFNKSLPQNCGSVSVMVRVSHYKRL